VTSFYCTEPCTLKWRDKKSITLGSLLCELFIKSDILIRVRVLNSSGSQARLAAHLKGKVGIFYLIIYFSKSLSESFT